MASITQKINSVNGGISQQPDELKIPGQVVTAKNVLPDVTHGLQKRPGSKLIKTLNIGSTPSFTHGKWFSYYRDENEQYIGQVIRDTGNANDGYVRMWRCRDGHPMTVEGHVSNILSYLQHTTDDDIQTLTLNDTTFILNRTKPTGMTADVAPTQDNQAFVELKQIKYASQYNLDIFNNTNDLSTVSTATRLGINYTLGVAANNVNTIGSCDSVGTQMFTVNTADSASYITAQDKDANTISGRGTNLYFRITATGQPTTTGGASPTYVCRYTIKVDLLYGGEGWNTGDVIKVRMSNAATQTDYFVTIEESSAGTVSANLSLVRPSPTPFDGETAITADSILGGLKSAILDSSNSLVDPSTISATFSQYENTTIITTLNNYNHGFSVGDKIFLTFTPAYPTNVSDMNNATYTITAANATAFTVDRTENTNLGVATGYSQTGTVVYPKTDQSQFTVTQIGNGLLIKRPNTETSFNINTGVSELLNVLTTEVQDVADLPKQCKDGYVVKIRNSANDEDDYYVKFIANRDLDGEGVWEECAEPGRRIKIDAAKMPIQLQRTANLDTNNLDAEGNATPKFMLSQIDWEDCGVGSPLTAPKPSFISTVSGIDGDNATVNRYINKMIFFRNRLVLLSDENIVMSRPGDFFNFFPKSAIAASAEDPIDLSCSSEYPAIVYDGIQVNTGLVLFTKNQQFMLTTDSDVLSPVTAKINALSTYNFNEKTNPISLGTTVAFLDNAGKFTRMFEMASVLREGEPIILEQSKIISKLFPKNINLIANSRENSLIIFAEKSSNKIYCYRYYTSGEKRLMQSWFTWELSEPIQHLCMLDDAIYAVVGTAGAYVLQRINIKLTDEATESVTQNSTTYKVYLDNISSVTTDPTTYNSSTNKTIFTKPNGYTSSRQLAAYDIDTGNDIGLYTLVTVNGSNLEITGDWSGQTFLLGYTYDMEIKFPKFYYTQQSGDRYITDVQSNLIIHRVKFNFGPLGTYETTLKREGKPDYNETFESRYADQYAANSLVIDAEQEVTLPVYERNTNYTLTLKSSHPSPATLYSMAWEGDYTSSLYKRV